MSESAAAAATRAFLTQTLGELEEMVRAADGRIAALRDTLSEQQAARDALADQIDGLRAILAAPVAE